MLKENEMTVRKSVVIFSVIVLISLIVLTGMLCGISSEIVSVEAATDTTSDKWQSNGQTVNLTPQIVAGDTWDSLVAKGWGKDSDTPSLEVHETDYGYGVRPKSTGADADIGNHEDPYGGIYYTIYLSAADRVKAASGQLSISAFARYYRQSTASVDLTLRAEFHTEKGIDISTAQVISTDGGGSPTSLTLAETLVPKDTSYIEMWFSNSKTLSGRPWIADMQAYLHDSVAPSATSSALAENAAIIDRGGAIAGDTVRYSVSFNEKISVANAGTASISVAGTTVYSTSYELTENAGISVITYIFTIPEVENNGIIAFSGVSGASVRDEAGNISNIDYTGTPATLNYYAKALVTVDCENLSYSGDTTARFGTNATITLIANRGYNLPSELTVTIGGAQVENSFQYNSSNGQVTVFGSYIKGDIVITATAVAKTNKVIFDKQSGSGGTDNITVTFGGAMPHITSPVRTGYTFSGYFSERNGGGTKYYDESGNSLKNCDFDNTTTLYANWTANRYTVIYDGNKPSNASGQVSGSTSSSSHTYDSARALTANGFTLTGWTFLGWATSSSGEKLYNNNESVKNLTATNDGTVTLYALWQANTYTVTYESNKPAAASSEISGSTSSSSQTYDAASPLTANGFTLTGWTFLGWATSSSGSKVYENNQSVKNLTATNGETVTLYAVWEANTYTVNYNANKPVNASSAISGNTTNSTHTYDTEKALTANGFTLTGWTFLGWTTTFSGTKEYENNEIVKNLTDVNGGTVTLYALWEANTYTVTYEGNKPAAASNAVSGITAVSAHTYDTISSLTPNGFTLTGWTFTGWNTREDGQGTTYTDGQNVNALVSTNGGDITLYAVWKANTYTIYYNTAGGSGAGSNTVTFDSDLPDLHIVPARNGYNFLGYFDKADGEGNRYYDEDGSPVVDLKYTTTDNLTVYAYWQPITYTVVLYSEGNYVSSLECTFGSLTLPSAATLGLTRTNYDFVGWNIYDEQNWSMYSADKEYKVGLTDENGSQVTVYAAWLERPLYILNYDANGGTGAPATVQIHQGETVSLSEQEPVRENYTFSGWASSADKSEVEYLPGGEFTISDKAVTLYAVWLKNPALSYDANGGAFNSDIIVTYPKIEQTVTLTSSVPYRRGYDFLGWATTSEANEADCLSTFVMPETDTVLYAVWKIQRFVLTISAPVGYTVEGISNGSEAEFGTEISFTVTGENAVVYVGGTKLLPEEGVYYYTVKEETEIKVSDGTELFVLYSANGGSGAPSDANGYSSGDTATVSAAPGITRKGYTFLGWSTDKDASEKKYSEGETITFSSETITLYAVWEANAYSVKYYSENVSSVTISTFYYDRAGTLATDLFQKRGHTFVGWAIEEGGDAVYSDGAEVRNLSEDNGAEISLYAVWKNTVTEITFDFAGGTDGSESMAVAFGTVPDTETVLPPVKKGYVFLGYYTAPSITEGICVFDGNMNLVNSLSGFSAMARSTPAEQTDSWELNEESITLYAVYAGVNYTVVYIDGGAEKGSQSAVYGEAFSLLTASSLGIIAPENHTFAGWSVVPEGVVAYADGQEITNGLAETEGAEFYLYAIFEENEKIRVFYDANGGMNAPVDNNSYYIDTDIDISSVIPEKEGYIFAGWGYDNKNVVFAYSAENGAFTPAIVRAKEDVRLYAVWTPGELLQTQIDEIRTVSTELGLAVEALQAKDNEIDEQITVLLNRIIAAEGAMQSPDETFATDEELASAINALKSVLEEADNALQNVEEADNALQNAINEVQANLDTAVAELNGNLASEVATLNEKIAALDTAYKAADALINSDISALKEADSDIKASINEVQANLDTAVAELNGNLASEAATLNEKINALDTAYKAADTLINSDISALKEADSDIKASITALDTSYKAADNALQNAINEVQENLDTAVSELNGSLTSKVDTLNEKIAALDTAYKAADTLINSDISALKEADSDIKASMTALDTAYKAADNALQNAINEVQENLDTAVSELNGSLTAEVGTLNEKIAALDTAYKAADTLINSDISALKEADSGIKASITALDTAYKAADNALQNAINEVQANLDTAVSELNGSLTAEVGTLNEKINALDTSYKAADSIIKSEIAAITGIDGSIYTSLTALETAYKAADATLKIAIENLQKKLDSVQDELEGKDKFLETEINNITAENDRLAKIYMWVNIALGALAAVLLAMLIVKAVKAKKAE